MPDILPAIFFGHGNPMNALMDNVYTRAWQRIGERTPRPRAILSISAHWFVAKTGVTISTSPRTIHDFGGFPQELYQVRYPAPGDPDLARKVQAMLAPLPVNLDNSWGLDHGTWSVLCHVYPEADIPVVQLSIDETQPPSFHFELGRRLAPLRDEGVLIVGSGNLVHNLHTYASGRHMPEPYDWAVRFEKQAREMMLAGEFKPLVGYEKLGGDDCFLVLRGIKTLAIRMEEHNRNALAIVRWLESHPRIARVHHPGLPSYPQHELAVRQMSGYGGTFSFRVKGGGEEALRLPGGLQIFTLAESLGGVESLVEHPFTMTHASVPEASRIAMGITPDLVRISVGLEEVNDLIQDLERAF